MEIKLVRKTERGWLGHFICGDRCRFRRNTLLECGETRVVVSTVGNLYIDGKLETIGADRHAETMAFRAKKEGIYWEADVENEIVFRSPWQSNIVDDDTKLDEMHESVILEIVALILGGKIV